MMQRMHSIIIILDTLVCNDIFGFGVDEQSVVFQRIKNIHPRSSFSGKATIGTVAIVPVELLIKRYSFLAKDSYRCYQPRILTKSQR